MKIHNRRNRMRALPLQLKYTMFLTLIAGFSMLVMIFVMAWFIQRNYNLFLGDELGVSAQLVELVRREQRLLETSLLLLFLFTITISFVSALYVIRKLTGPIMALERTLLAYSQGDYTRDFRLRHTDEFRQFEMIVNQLRHNHLHTHQSSDSQHGTTTSKSATG